MKEKTIAVLVPCFNEELTIAKVIGDFKAALPKAVIYVFDNNSSDKTALIAKHAGAIVIPESRQGKGNVVRSMFRKIDADYYVMVDGDDTYEAQDAIALLCPIEEGRADMVIGDRLSGAYFTENKRMFHNSGNKLVRFLINSIFRSHVRDIMTGYRAFSRRFVKTFPVLSGGFEIETEMTIHALDKRLPIDEMPVGYRDRPEGSVSKLNTVRDGFRVLSTIVSLFRDFRPLSFFGCIAFVLFTSGSALFIPILLEFLTTHLVPKFPTLIVCVGLWIMSMLILICGIILSSIKKYTEQFFELAILKSASETIEPIA